LQVGNQTSANPQQEKASTMTALYSLTEQFRSLNALAESDEDIPEDVLRDTLEALGGELQLKAQNVARVVANQDAMAEAIENASKAMAVRAKRLRSRTDWLRNYLLVNMQAAGITRIESPELVVAVKKNPASVIVFDESAVPEEFMEQKPAPPPAPNKARIKAILATGDDVPGCRLEQRERVDIK
jgi:hypothetical protein